MRAAIVANQQVFQTTLDSAFESLKPYPKIQETIRTMVERTTKTGHFDCFFRLEEMVKNPNDETKRVYLNCTDAEFLGRHLPKAKDEYQKIIALDPAQRSRICSAMNRIRVSGDKSQSPSLRS